MTSYGLKSKTELNRKGFPSTYRYDTTFHITLHSACLVDVVNALSAICNLIMAGYIIAEARITEHTNKRGHAYSQADKQIYINMESIRIHKKESRKNGLARY